METFRVPKYLAGETTTIGTIVFRDREELVSFHTPGTELNQAKIEQ